METLISFPEILKRPFRGSTSWLCVFWEYNVQRWAKTLSPPAKHVASPLCTARTAPTYRDPWRCPVPQSGTNTLAADLSSPVRSDVEPPWIRLVGPAHPTDAQLDWRLRQHLQHCVPQNTPKQSVQNGMVHYPAETGFQEPIPSRLTLPWKGAPGLNQV